MSGLRRILVAVDASPLSLEALDTAARLARRQGAELAAVYVEDAVLSLLSNHPQVMAVSLMSARRLHPDEMMLGGALALQLAEARRAAERVCGARGFTMRRGRVALELLDAAREADLLVIGWCGRPAGHGPPRLGTTARAVLAAASTPVLLSQRAVHEGHPVVLLHDGSPSSERALVFAAALAAGDGGRLDTLLLTPDPRRAGAIRPAVDAAMAAHGLTGDIHRLSPGDIGRLRHLAESLPGCVLVTGAAVGEELDLLRCSVVVVR